MPIDGQDWESGCGGVWLDKGGGGDNLAVLLELITPPANLQKNAIGPVRDNQFYKSHACWALTTGSSVCEELPHAR